MSEYKKGIYIAFGSNIAPEKNLQAALDLLRMHCDVLRCSSVYQSPAFGFEEQDDFLDIIVEVGTALTPEQLKRDVLSVIERQLGRDRANQANKYGPLTLDADILLWGEKAFSYGEKPWQVPDKNVVKQAAVAIPLAALAPELIHPLENVPLRDIAARLDASSVRLRDDLSIG